MQVLWDWLVAHATFVLIALYELWSLLPESWVKSSSVLTLIGNLLKALKDENQPKP